MKIVPVNREDIPTQPARTNSTSNLLIEEFLDSGSDVARIDLEGKKGPSVRSSLTTFIKRHNKPVNVFGRGVDLYIQRSDATVLEDTDAVELPEED